MLPLLPALLLLIFRGPSVAEKANLGAAFQPKEAVYQKFASRKSSRSQALRALLSISEHPAFTQAIAELLQLIPDEPATPLSKPASPKRSRLEATKRDLQDGFCDCRRSRDGPSLV
jgi:hypothetical protein